MHEVLGLPTQRYVVAGHRCRANDMHAGPGGAGGEYLLAHSGGNT